MAYHTKFVSFTSNWVDGHHGQKQIKMVYLSEPVPTQFSGAVQYCSGPLITYFTHLVAG